MSARQVPDPNLKASRKKRTKRGPLHEADTLFSLWVRKRDRFCQGCGTPRELQCAHGFSRSYRRIRFDGRNAFALCRGCHLHFTHRPIEWERWLRAQWGDDLYDEMQRIALDTDGPKVNLKGEVVRLKALLAEAAA